MTPKTKAPPPFIVRWRGSLRNSGLRPNVRLVGYLMSDYADTHTGRNVCPSVDRIAAETGLSRRHIAAYRQELVAAGLAVVVRRGGSPKGGNRQNSVFALTIPAATRDAESPVEIGLGTLSRQYQGRKRHRPGTRRPLPGSLPVHLPLRRLRRPAPLAPPPPPHRKTMVIPLRSLTHWEISRPGRLLILRLRPVPDA